MPGMLGVGQSPGHVFWEPQWERLARMVEARRQAASPGLAGLRGCALSTRPRPRGSWEASGQGQRAQGVFRDVKLVAVCQLTGLEDPGDNSSSSPWGGGVIPFSQESKHKQTKKQINKR